MSTDQLQVGAMIVLCALSTAVPPAYLPMHSHCVYNWQGYPSRGGSSVCTLHSLTDRHAPFEVKLAEIHAYLPKMDGLC